MSNKDLPEIPKLPQKPSTFEDNYEIIHREVMKRSNKWTLTALPYIDYQDVASIIEFHIFKKFNMWDQSRPLIPWLGTLIHHQISNLIRNNYSSFSRPCLKCPANEGDNYCSIYGTQDVQCPLYLKWTKSKKNAHDIKLALPIVNHEIEVYQLYNESLDIEKTGKELHKKMLSILTGLERRIYKLLFIQNKSEEDAAEILGFRTTEKNRKAGYRTICVLKKKIINKVRQVLYSGDIDFHK